MDEYEYICTICLVMSQYKYCNCDTDEAVISLKDFLAQVSWEKLEKEKSHLQYVADNYPDFRQNCLDKIGRIEKLQELH